MLCTIGPVSPATAQPSDAAAERALIDNERRIVQAIARHDKATFRTLVSDDAVWASGGGFVPAAIFGEALDLADGAATELVNPQVVWVNPTTAIVAYSRTGSAGSAGLPKVIASTVWTRRGARWVAVYHQESDAPRP